MLPPFFENTLRYDPPSQTRRVQSGRNFLLQVLDNPLTIGAVAPSSALLANTIANSLDLTNAQTLVELGPGTGVFTECLNRVAPKNTTCIAIELNKRFAAVTKEKCPSVHVYNDSAANLRHYLNIHDAHCADVIVSSLPWTIFTPVLQDQLMAAVVDCLKPGGTFVSIVYLGARFRSGGRYFYSLMQQNFQSIDRIGPVWLNLPPTLIFHCKNNHNKSYGEISEPARKT